MGKLSLVFAHRGSSRDHSENTKSAFEHARDVGSDWVELDVRRTSDGKMVIHHDAALRDGRVIVDCLRSDLPDEVLDLDAALDICAPMGVNIEIKNLAGDPDADPTNRLSHQVVELLRSRQDADEVLITSFDRPTIDTVRTIAPDIAVGWLLYNLTAADIASTVETATQQGYVGLNPWDPTVTAELVDRAHEASLVVNVWTVDDPARMSELLAMGVDGIITNVPAIARTVVDAAT